MEEDVGVRNRYRKAHKGQQRKKVKRSEKNERERDPDKFR